MNQRVRVSLSEEAQDTIKNDMLCFEGDKPKYNTAINRIFQSYFMFAKHDKKTFEDYVLEKKRSIADKGKGVQYLQEDSMKLLEPEEEPEKILDIINKFYNKKPGRFIKSVIEQYASELFSKREIVYFKDKVEIIENAITNHNKLKIIHKTDGLFIVRPYRILNDKHSTFNYLVGFSSKKGDEPEKIASIRISRIRSVKEISDKYNKYDIYPNEIKQIKDKILSSGVAFLIDDAIKVIVKLTDNGRKFYNTSHIHRPIYLRINGDEYEFKCTALQAEAYFLKFGADAEIIEPVELREKFISKYKEAYEMYDKPE